MKEITNLLRLFLCLICPICCSAQNLEVHTLIPDINASGGMSIDVEGHIYVSDFGPALGQNIADAKVYKIDKNDFSVSVFAGGFEGASGACFDSQGNFYQSNPHGQKVSKRIASGELELDWATENLNTPIGIIANNQDEIFVCNCSSNTIGKISETGEVNVFASDDLLQCPNGLTIDDEDNLYACNYGDGKVIKIAPDGTVSLVVELPVLTAGPTTVGCGHLTFLHGFLFVNTIGTGQVFKVSLMGETELIAGTAFGFSSNDGIASQATFSKPNGIIASVTGDTLFINDSEPTWQGGNLNLHPGHVRMVTGICSLPDIQCDENPPTDAAIFTQVTAGHIVTDLNLSMGSSWADYNQDGFVDILVMTGNGNNKLYQNNGDGTFTLDNGIVSNDGGASSAAVWGDFDNDGDLDLYVSNNPPTGTPAESNFLYQNSGAPDFTFSKLTTEAPTTIANYTWSSSWVDVDNDGDLDLHVPDNKHLNTDFFYENNGVPNASGQYFMDIMPSFVTPDVESTGVASWMDYDNDGDQDLFMIKSGRTHAQGQEDHRMFHNTLSETGILDFQRVVTAEMVNHFDLDFQASWGDYDNDGDMDVFLGNFDSNNYLYRNEGDSLFTRITEGDVATENYRTLGSTWGDFDNDGDLDLYATSAGQVARFYENDGNGHLNRQGISVAGPAATNISNTQSCSSADFNNDGYLDIFVGNAALSQTELLPDFLYQNKGGDNGYFILTCQGTESNWSGIGTKIRLKVTINGEEKWLMRVVSGSPTGDRAQNSLRAHFGLGDAVVIDSLVIEWTSGQTDIYTQVQTEQICTAIEGEGMDCLLASNTIDLPDFVHAFKITPNPVQDDTVVMAYDLNGVEQLSFSLYNLKGQLLQRYKTSNKEQFEFPITNLNSGIYFIKMTTEQGSMTRKFAKL